MLLTIGRLFLVPIAFLLAAAVSLVVVVTLGLEKVTHAMHGKEAGLETIEAYYELFAKGLPLLATVTMLPALAVILIGEVARIRSWLYYMVGGGLALGLMPLLARAASSEVLAAPPATVWQVLATAGFAGGLVYWLVAGRSV